MRRLNPKALPERAREILDHVQPSAVSERTLRVNCKLITPMFGGGVKAGEVDSEMPIRASALRGQLRFWWRLLNAVNRTSEELFTAESELWGGISKEGPQASKVTLQVKCARASDRELVTKKMLDGERPKRLPAYALILEPKANPTFLNAGYNFELVFGFENAEQRTSVIEALRWWASFAGVGARTRRGLGAVHATAKDMALEPVKPEEVARRGGWMVTGPPKSDAMAVWSDAVDALQEFRQGAHIGRNPGSSNNRPGRSRWPEADTIRRLKEENAPNHEPVHPVDGFPRAAFGLPLVFHFKDREDPKGVILAHVDHERMASPLILRPWFDGKGFRPAALLLPGWEERVSVPVSIDQGQNVHAWPKESEQREELAQKVCPLHRQRAADALSAFMDYFAERMNEGR